MNDELSTFTKTHKTMGIVVAIIMILLGIGIFVAPLFSASIIIWLFIAGLVFYGFFVIFAYTKSNVKNGWNLASGIMAIILGVLLVFSSPLARADTFAFMLAFIALTTGINQLSVASILKKQNGASNGWLIFSGIINILLFFFFIFNPFVMLLTFGILGGVYLVFGGIALFATTMSN
jgi:uncharacterized membrane protein HdeD (DUF308 family)